MVILLINLLLQANKTANIVIYILNKTGNEAEQGIMVFVIFCFIYL